MLKTDPGYSPEQLKELIDATAGWARRWDDVVFYLERVAMADTHLPEDVVDRVAADVLHAKQQDVAFSADYRRLWEVVTGESGEALPAPARRDTTVDPISVRQRYLAGATFPAGKGSLYAWAEDHGAPWGVLEIVRALPDRRYQGIDDVLDAMGDIAWQPPARKE